MASSSSRGGAGGGPPASEGELPGQLANVAPPATPMMDHSFTLQAIMDLKGSVASFGTKIDRLIDDVGKHGEKIDTIRNQISFVRGATWVIGALLALLIAVAAVYVRLQPH